MFDGIGFKETETIPDMTPQEVFDRVATHLFAQGRRSTKMVLAGEMCCYRSPDGLKCAVGALIPDALYDPAMDVTPDGDNTGVHSVVRRFPQLAPFEQNLGLLSRLQYKHDQGINWGSSAQLRKSLSQVAEEYNLDPSILDTLHFPSETPA